MSEIHRTDRPRVDEMRLLEIEGWWEDCREAQDGLMGSAEAVDEDDLLRVVMETDATINLFLEVAVPEMLQELGRRFREDGND